MVIKFDLSSIPANVTITKATFEMFKYDNGAFYFSGMQNLYVATRDWQASSTSWTSPWSTPGGDYNSSTLSEYYYNAHTYTWHDYTVTSAVKGFYANPGSNYGFILHPSPDSNPEWNDYRNFFRSSEYSVQTDRPKLTITYEEPNSIVNTKNLKNDQILVKYKESYMIYTPFAGTVYITDLQGKQLSSFNAETGSQWYQLPKNLSSGMHILTLKSQGRSISKKVQLIR